MRIKAGNYYINSDSNQNVWITEEVVGKKTGKLSEKRVSGYCNNLKSALKDMIVRKVYGSDSTSLEDAVNTLSNVLEDALKIIEVKEI